MIVAGIRETKARLSSYLAAVRAGEEVLITDRGRPVARIIREPARTASLTEQLAGLAAAGIVTLPTDPAPRAQPIPQRVPGRPLSDIVREDRR
jgi:prevent-host-death family protein